MKYILATLICCVLSAMAEEELPASEVVKVTKSVPFRIVTTREYPKEVCTTQKVPIYEPEYEYKTVQVDTGANTAGAIVGGAAGGVVGHQIGGGSGKKIATVGGAVLGTLVGANAGRYKTQTYRRVVGQRVTGYEDEYQCTTEYIKEEIPSIKYELHGKRKNGQDVVIIADKPLKEMSID